LAERIGTRFQEDKQQFGAVKLPGTAPQDPPPFDLIRVALNNRTLPQRIGSLRCPSDDYNKDAPASNYAASMGPQCLGQPCGAANSPYRVYCIQPAWGYTQSANWGDTKDPTQARGLFTRQGAKIRIPMILDGTSNTILLGEILVGHNGDMLFALGVNPTSDSLRVGWARTDSGLAMLSTAVFINTRLDYMDPGGNQCVKPAAKRRQLEYHVWRPVESSWRRPVCPGGWVGAVHQAVDFAHGLQPTGLPPRWKGGRAGMISTRKSPAMSMRPILPLALMLAVAHGCGEAKPVPVRGLVTVAGKPLAGAGVVFHPQNAAGRMAHAATGADGRFELTTFVASDGVMPGEYKVTIAWEEPPPEWTQYRDSAPLKEELKKKWLAEGGDKKPPVPSPVPTVYADPATTPLTQTVPPAGEVNFDLPAKTP
jgi:hypothetical protein